MAFTHEKLLNKMFKDGVWQGREDRVIVIAGVEHDLDEYAKQHSIVLPDSQPEKKAKKEINTDVEDKGYGDMEEQTDEGDTSVD
jgi:hypothetical protein